MKADKRFDKSLLVCYHLPVLSIPGELFGALVRAIGRKEATMSDGRPAVAASVVPLVSRPVCLFGPRYRSQ